jgi:hypothetical protein
MFARLARMLGVAVPELEDALRSEKRAKAQLSRRGLLLAGAAGVTTAILPSRAWSFPSTAPSCLFVPGVGLVHAGFWTALLNSFARADVARALAFHLGEPLFP